MDDTDWPASTPPAELTIDELIATIHDHLEATERIPLDATTNRWLGEAQAIAADLATDEVSAAVASRRAATIVELLEQTGRIETQAASEHVDTSLAAARELATRG